MKSIFHTAKRQVALKRWLKFTELLPYAKVAVWVCGLKSQYKVCFLPMVQNIMRLWKASGRVFLVAYLKECCKILVLWVSGNSYSPAERGVRVARARSGLPLLLPARLRWLISSCKRSGSLQGWVALRVTLTILSVYRVIGCRPILKLETITSPFDGSATTLPDVEVRHAITCLGVTLKVGKSFPNLFSEAAGPNYPRATWSAGLDALAFLRYPLQWVRFLVIAFKTQSWSLLSWWLGVQLFTAPVLPLLVILGVMPTKLGRLSKLFEAAGKVRVIAITDWWTQCLLYPLHKSIFDQLRVLPCDGTFDQIPALQKVREYSRGRPAFSFDLTAATDRLPIALQVQILSALGLSWAVTWAQLLTEREWWLGSKPIKYAVGQPMGAYSSWAMLAMTHHVIVQVSAYRVGWRHSFPYYCVLGDDIVIFDHLVAKEYQNLMALLGVPINLTKSLVSERGALEFAKRWFHPDLGDFSPIGPGVILVAIRNLRFIPLVVNELASKNFDFMPAQLKDLMSLMTQLRRKLKVSPQVISLLALGPTGGLWGSGQLSHRCEAWIASFHKSCAPDLLSLHVFHAICAYTIVQARQAVDTVSAAEKNLIQNWMRFPLLGTSLVMAVLSMPLMLLSPGLWATLEPLSRGVNISVKWEAQGLGPEADPFSYAEHAARQMAMRDVMTTYIGSVSALNWADRRKVLDFFAAQDFILDEVSRTLKDGLYDGGALVPYTGGGQLVRWVPRTLPVSVPMVALNSVT